MTSDVDRQNKGGTWGGGGGGGDIRVCVNAVTATAESTAQTNVGAGKQSKGTFYYIVMRCIKSARGACFAAH